MKQKNTSGIDQYEMNYI